jgi:hypothetical protein
VYRKEIDRAEKLSMIIYTEPTASICLYNKETTNKEIRFEQHERRTNLSIRVALYDFRCFHFAGFFKFVAFLLQLKSEISDASSRPGPFGTIPKRLRLHQSG